MSQMPTTLSTLIDINNLAVDEMLIACLNDLEPQNKLHALSVLLQRQHAEYLVKLVDRYDELPEACRFYLTGHLDQMEAALRTAIKSPHESTRINVVSMITHGQGYSLTYLLGLGLHSSCSTTRAKSGIALHTLTANLIKEMRALAQSGQKGRTEFDIHEKLSQYQEAMNKLLDTLREAVNTYEVHRRIDVIEAALSLSLELEEALIAESVKPNSKCWRGICDKLRQMPEVHNMAFLLQGLAHKETRNLTAPLIAQCQDSQLMNALLESCWLLGDADIRAGCTSIRQFDWLEHHNEALFSMNDAQFRQLVRFLNATRVPMEQRAAWYKYVLLSDQMDKQKTALWALVDTPDEASTEVLRFCLDWSSPELVGIAKRALERRLNTQDLLVSRPEGASSTPSDANTNTHVESLEQYWQKFDQLPKSEQFKQGRALYKNQTEMHEFLLSKLRSKTSSERLRAIQIMRHLHLVRAFKEALDSCVHDEDGFVRSAALKALSQTQEQMPQRLIDSALSDPDRRVRANAVEVLDRNQAKRNAGQLQVKLQDPDNRVRATVVKKLLELKMKEAAESLIQLLGDPSRAHRISALWVIERLNLSVVMNRVRILADSDPDPTVRRRAQRVLFALKVKKDRNVHIPPPKEPNEV